MTFKEFIYSEEGRLIIAFLVGALIGAEREYRSKAAGFRTVILVTMGSCLFTLLSIKMVGDSADQSRIAANIVTGIGFLGAGAIYRDKISIRGITTATTIWVAAALGMAIGSGEYEAAALVTAITMLTLVSFTWFQNVIDRINQEKTYKIVFEHVEHVEQLEKLFYTHELDFQKMKQLKNEKEIIIMYTANGRNDNHILFVDELYRVTYLKSFEA